MRAVSLLYHDIGEPGHWGESGFGGSDADLYKLAVSDFERHLDAIAATGHLPTSTVSDLPGRSADRKDVPVFLTFDDGGASSPAIASMLDRRGWKGHFFVSTDFIGSAGFVDAAAIRDLHARGHVVGSHSCSHPPRISHLDDADLQREWERSIAVLEQILGTEVNTASVPGGFYSERVTAFAARAGIRVLFNSEPVQNVLSSGDCLVLGRFGLQRHSRPALAAKFAARDRRTLLREAAFWNAKKLVKTAGGEQWLAFRKWWLAR